jgi:hypothetical protein
MFARGGRLMRAARRFRLGRVAAAFTVLLASAPAANASLWAVQSNSGSGDLTGVACTSRTACTAVGDAPTGGGSSTRVVVERLNGARWSSQSAPAPVGSHGASLLAISCVSRTGCVAVGVSYKRPGGLDSVTLAERWNGSHWSITPTPPAPHLHDGTLDAVSCSSPSSCSATGTYLTHGGNSTSVAERWNGRRWSLQELAAPVNAHAERGSEFLSGISCASQAVCTAVGTAFFTGASASITLAERWNGHDWSVQRTPNPSGSLGSALIGVDCTAPSSCYAVGDMTVPSMSSSSPPTQEPLVEHWNGHRWSMQTTPRPSIQLGSELNSISCTSASVCLAAGDGPSGLATVAESWNRRHWSLSHTPSLSGSSNGFFGIACLTHTLCFGVGTSQARLLIERYS